MFAFRGVRRNSREIIGIARSPVAMWLLSLQSRDSPGTSTGRPAQRPMGWLERMVRVRTTLARLGAFLRIAATACVFAAPLGGCFSETYQRGYILPEGALEQIPIGASQEQVLIVLGTPSTVATVSGEAFYYISQRAERPIAFMPQEAVDQCVVAVYFDKGRRAPRCAIYGMQ